MILTDDYRTRQDQERRAYRAAQAAQHPPQFLVPALSEPVREPGKRLRKPRPARWSPPSVAPEPGTCHCGCGGHPVGRRSRFLPGHDTRMRARAS